jgi:hypothetical protein
MILDYIGLYVRTSGGTDSSIFSFILLLCVMLIATSKEKGIKLVLFEVYLSILQILRLLRLLIPQKL